MNRLRDERGSAGLQVAVLAPVLLVMVLLVVAIGRSGKAEVTVGDAAFDGARAASIARDPGQAMVDARSAARNVMDQQGLRCASSDTSVDVSGFQAPPGTPATVVVTVSCRVDLSGLDIPGVPSAKTYTKTARSPVDTFRERGTS